MDLYTLTETFLADQVVDEYTSAIWTERYSSAGDVQLVVPATTEMMTKLADGTFLALRGSNEVMILKTQSIENKLMTVKGLALPEFLNERISWFKNPDRTSDSDTSNGDKIVDYTDDTKKAGEFIADVVTKMVISPTTIPGAAFLNVNLDWDNEKIQRLTLGSIDATGDVKRFTMPTGPLYDGIKNIANQEDLGFTMYLESADPVDGYSLKFTVYRGKDRTSDQSLNPLVRLLPDMEMLSDVKEIRSRSNYKNVCYAWYKDKVYVYYADAGDPPEGFDRHVLVTDVSGEPVGRKVSLNYGGIGYYGGGWAKTVVTSGDILDFVAQNAKDALANHNYIRTVDGQASPNSDYKYGVDYGLGDIIELKGVSGDISKARVTEYIRSEDQAGEKEYPTISVL